EFPDNYWLERDRDGRFPFEFHAAMAAGGWLGIAMPEEFGGAGLGVTEAALMMKVVAGSGGGLAAASSIHMNIFGPHTIVVHATPEQQRRGLPPPLPGPDPARVCVTAAHRGRHPTPRRPPP